MSSVLCSVEVTPFFLAFSHCSSTAATDYPTIFLLLRMHKALLHGVRTHTPFILATSVLHPLHPCTRTGRFYADSFARFHYKGKQDDAAAVAAMRECAAFDYLEDSSTAVCGYNVFGSPWQPAFCDWYDDLHHRVQIN